MPKVARTTLQTHSPDDRVEIVRQALDQSLRTHPANCHEQTQQFLSAIRPQTARSKVRIQYASDPVREKKERNALASQRNRENKLEYDCRLDVAQDMLAAEIRNLEQQLLLTQAGASPAAVALLPRMDTAPLNSVDEFLNASFAVANKLRSSSPSSMSTSSSCSADYSSSADCSAATPVALSPSSASLFDEIDLTRLIAGMSQQFDAHQSKSQQPSSMESCSSDMNGPFASSSTIMSAVLALQWRLWMAVLVALNIQMPSTLSTSTPSTCSSMANSHSSQPSLPKSCENFSHQQQQILAWLQQGQQLFHGPSQATTTSPPLLQHHPASLSLAAHTHIHAT